MNYELTVVCMTYNHEKYLRQTLDGFIMQKTNFRFKVVVHDDASIDSTGRIILEYAELYPEIIYPILQTENQYSKKIDLYDTFIAENVEGRYIALCEGDDYWIDPNKLQIQYDYMTAHPDCSMCVHNTKRVTNTGFDTGVLFNESDEDIDYSTEEIIISGGCCPFHTSSFMLKKEYRYHRPPQFYIRGIGDYPLSIWASLNGRVHYIGRVMSAYREYTPGSWSSRHSSVESVIRTRDYLINGLKAINEYTQGKYRSAISYKIRQAEFTKMRASGKTYKSLFFPRYWTFLFPFVFEKVRSKIRK